VRIQFFQIWENDAIFAARRVKLVKLHFTAALILRIELAPRRGERQK
jgi:hypothetical protein